MQLTRPLATGFQDITSWGIANQLSQIPNLGNLCRFDFRMARFHRYLAQYRDSPTTTI